MLSEGNRVYELIVTCTRYIYNLNVLFRIHAKSFGTSKNEENERVNFLFPRQIRTCGAPSTTIPPSFLQQRNHYHADSHCLLCTPCSRQCSCSTCTSNTFTSTTLERGKANIVEWRQTSIKLSPAPPFFFPFYFSPVFIFIFFEQEALRGIEMRERETAEGHR